MAKRQGATKEEAEALAALERFGGAAGAEGDAPEEDRADDRADAVISFAKPAARQVRPAMGVLMQPQPVPTWYKVASPLLFIVGGALVVIGLWAVGAMAYMQSVKPVGPEFAVNYPLIKWEQGPVEAEGEGGKWEDSSVRMAEIMLACLPLAAVMGGMVVVMRKQMMRARE